LGRLGDAIRGTLVSRRSHDYASAQSLSDSLDLLIARGNNNSIKLRTHFRPSHYVLDHWPAEQRRERLTRKARRAHPRRNHGNDSFVTRFS
jgi:hypothetical protein